MDKAFATLSLEPDGGCLIDQFIREHEGFQVGRSLQISRSLHIYDFLSGKFVERRSRQQFQERTEYSFAEAIPDV